MAKRGAEEILAEIHPKKTAQKYENEWKSFVEYSGTKEDYTEEDFMQYFDMLHIERGNVSTTIWKKFSFLNDHAKMFLGYKLQDKMHRLYAQLKSYDKTHERKAAPIFTFAQILTFLQMTIPGPKSYWLLRKCACAISFVGGLRTAELNSLCFKNLTEDEDGLWIDYEPVKQRGVKSTGRFVVPRNKENPSECFFQHCKAYLDYVRERFGGEVSGRLFLTCLKNGSYSSNPMGINYMYKIPREVAEVLKLPNAPKFSGHSFRRSSATHLADSGANSAMMRRFYGWKDDVTCNKYLDKSRPNGLKIGSLLTKGTKEQGIEDGNVVQSGVTSSKGNRTYNINIHAGAIVNLY